MQLLRSETKSADGCDGTSGDECARHVLDVTPPTIRAIRQLMRSHRLRGLSVPQFRTLALLSFSPKASLSLVADHVGCSLPAASRMIDSLVAQKLVVRHTCSKDRRQISLALTARGHSAYVASRHATRQQLAKRLESLSPAKRKAVIQAMYCLAEVFGSDTDQPAMGNNAGNNGGSVRSAKTAVSSKTTARSV